MPELEDVHCISLDHWKKVGEFAVARCYQCAEQAKLPAAMVGDEGLVENVDCPHCGFKGTIRLGGWGVY